MISKLFIPIKPTPASRPRISRYGSYYPKGYTEFRKQIYKFFKGLEREEVDSVSEFRVELEVICYKPQKPTNNYPRGDVDNYLKAYMDSITYAQLAWEDDIQVTEIVASKRYQKDGENYGAYLTITRCEGTSVN